jgi:ribosome-associated protein
MSALVDILSKEVPKEEARLLHREGESESGWVLLDYGDVIVHLFSPDARPFYALEELWQAGTPVVRIQ